MSLKPLVTIAIPTYNRAGSYLRTALESALRQTYGQTEVLVIDNASTDHTPDLVRSYEEAYPQLRYIRRPENQGPTDNFEHCLDLAEGEFFLMLHDDDCLDTDFLTTCLKAIDYDTDVGYVRTGIRSIDARGNLVHEYPNEAGDLQHEAYINAWLRNDMYWYFTSSLLNTELFRSLGGFVTEIEQLVDFGAFVRFAFESRGVNVRPIKASFREHDERITGNANAAEWAEELKKIKELIVDRSYPEWKPTLASHADEFFGLLSCRWADGIPHRLRRLYVYILIARAFGLRSIPRPLSKVVRCIAPSPVERYLEQRLRSWRRAGNA